MPEATPPDEAQAELVDRDRDRQLLEDLIRRADSQHDELMAQAGDALYLLNRKDLTRQMVVQLLGEIERNELVERVVADSLRTLAFARAGESSYVAEFVDKALAATGWTKAAGHDLDPLVEELTELTRVLLDRVFDDVEARLARQLPLTVLLALIPAEPRRNDG